MAKRIPDRLSDLVNGEVGIIEVRHNSQPLEVEYIVTFPNFPLLPGTFIVTPTDLEGLDERICITSYKLFNGIEQVKAMFEDGEQRVSPKAIRKMLQEQDAWLLFFDRSILHRIPFCC